MSKYSVAPITATSMAHPDIDKRDVHALVEIDWRWPDDTTWSRIRLVRTLRSPAERVEEGLTLIEEMRGNWYSMRYFSQTPYFQDPQPVPGEWNFYSVFLLDEDRVWVRAGWVADIGIDHHGWTLEFPELMPGHTVSRDRGTLHPGSQSNDLVEFLQPMGTYLDRAVTVGDSMRFFWDPNRCAPKMLPYLSGSWGYPYDSNLGMIRYRPMLSTLRRNDQGSLVAINAFATAVTGSDTRSFISDNLMLTVNDSSFESPTKDANGWEPQSAYTITAYASDYPVVAPPNVLVTYYCSFAGAATIKCGSYGVTGVNRTFDPRIAGVPVSGWTGIRMGCYMIDKSVEAVGTCRLSMGVDLYRADNTLIQSLTCYNNTTPSTKGWVWYYTGDETPGGGTERLIAIPTTDHVYAVPWVTVSHAAAVDLIAIDDG